MIKDQIYGGVYNPRSCLCTFSDATSNTPAPPADSDTLRKEVLAMKDSLAALSKAVSGLQGPIQSKPNQKPASNDRQCCSGAKCYPSYQIHTTTCGLINDHHKCQIRIAAARWTARGNLDLVVTARHGSTIEQLRASLPTIATAVRKALVPSLPLILNRVPTGASKRRDAYTPDECHAALAAENPSYAALPITQRGNALHGLRVLPIICL
ncbi:hypothetical protein BJV78DRAFT_1227998 [Lactifluus subvellereus]|nr:hypothetical protein BJV78DRAFT_1227998 [Lactifluus subvellereus]